MVLANQNTNSEDKQKFSCLIQLIHNEQQQHLLIDLEPILIKFQV